MAQLVKEPSMDVRVGGLLPDLFKCQSVSGQDTTNGSHQHKRADTHVSSWPDSLHE